MGTTIKFESFYIVAKSLWGDLIEDEFEKFDNRYKPDQNVFDDARQIFETYLTDTNLRDIIESKRFAELNTHPSGEFFKRLPDEYKTSIPEYIKDHIQLNTFLK